MEVYMRRRNFIRSVLFLCFLLLFFTAQVFAGGSKESANAPAQPKKITINVASTFPPNSPQDQGLTKFKQLVEQRTNGRMEVLVHPSNAMGDERQTFEMLSAGSVEFGAIGSNDISTFYPRYAVADTPYLFDSLEKFWKYWDGPGKELDQLIEKERNVRTMGVILRGARYLTANKPVKTVADVKGLKIRLPPVKAYQKVWEAYGALPATIAFGEVYMALKTGTVDAQENPPETILNYKFFEAQKYLMATEHVFAVARYQMSMKWFNSLNKEDQALITKAMDESVSFSNELTKNGDANFVKQLVEKGMILVEVDKKAFKEAAMPIIDALAASDWDAAFYAKVKGL